MTRYTVKFQVQEIGSQYYTKEKLEVYLKDLLMSSIFPTLEIELIPLSFEVKNSRKQNYRPPPANDGDGSRPTGGTQLLRREILAQDLQEWQEK